MFRFKAVNYWSVIVSWIAAIILGSLWYGVFFRESWMAATGATRGAMVNPVTSMVVMAFY